MGGYSMKKMKIAMLISILILNIPQNKNSVLSSPTTGIKPFSVIISKYHYYDQEKNESWDVDIGKDIKIIDYDGQTIKITKMGVLETKGKVSKSGPFLDKNNEPILLGFNDPYLDQFISDICTTYYQLKFIGEKNIIIAYNSKTMKLKGLYGLVLYYDKNKRGGVQLTKEQISDKTVSGQFAILDDDKQYQTYNIVGSNMYLSQKLAINPDNYDKKLPMLSQMLRSYYSSFQKLWSGYLLLMKDSKLYYDKGQKKYSNPPTMISRNGIYYISTYFISKRFHYGIMRNKELNNWKIIKIHNPNLYELSINELVIDKNDKTKATFNGQEKKLKHEWIDLSSENLDYDPYLSLKEFSEMFGFTYSYRDIDKSVLMP
jgi:hypothetical protein